MTTQCLVTQLGRISLGHPFAKLSRPTLRATLVLAIALSGAGQARAWDAWPCEVALCLANPMGPLAVGQCVPPILRAWRAWARGKIVPSCMGTDADGNETGVVKEVSIANTMADANKCPPQFVYYAGLQQLKYCALTGVTDQIIDGRLWGRIWYGGPDGKYFVEVLEQVPGVTPPTNTLLASWLPQKEQIERNSDAAVKQWAVARQADAAAATVESAATAARSTLDAAKAAIAWIESTMPAYLQRMTVEAASRRAEYSQLNTALQAAKAKAEVMGAKPADIAAYQSLIGPTEQVRVAYLAAVGEVNYANNQLDSLPGRRAQLPLLESTSARLDIQALTQRQAANNEWATLNELEAAAAPLPFGGGGL